MAKLVVDDTKSGRYEPNCKTCNSEHKDWIETQLLKPGASLRTVCRLLKERHGETFYPQSLSRHRDQHMSAWRADDPLDETIKALEHEAGAAPPTVASLYQVLIHQLRGLQSTSPSAKVAVDTAKAISDITGMRTKQGMLLAFMQKMFEDPQLPSSTTVERSDLAELED